MITIKRKMFNSPLLRENKGFLVIEILIAGLILTASIAATMYLFRVGFQHLGRADVSNILSSKLSQSINLIKTFDLEKKSGIEDIGDGVTLAWEARLLNSTRPVMYTAEGSIPSPHELYLYRVSFQLIYKDAKRDYETNIFSYKRLVSASEMLF
ncbi:MAG: hypothetical protein QMC83_02705 [Thermodesulfovibrionales bacterium]|nr:hypothetical protein [Thermodesulfovibrionales bacterium]